MVPCSGEQTKILASYLDGVRSVAIGAHSMFVHICEMYQSLHGNSRADFRDLGSGID
jgi:hypothetical protein